MQKNKTRRNIGILPLSLLIIGILSGTTYAGELKAEDGGQVTVKDAWIRAAPPSSTVLAGYLTIENRLQRPIEISKFESAIFSSVEIHETIIKAGQARMKSVPSLSVPANQNITLTPGGLHLMLFRPQHGLKPGDVVPMKVRTNHNQTLEFNATVRTGQIDEDHSHHH